MSDTKFHTLYDLLKFVEKYEALFKGPNMMGTQPGIMFQFMQFNIPPEARKEDEVMIVYYDPDFTTTPLTFAGKIQWFNKKTRMAIDGAPSWFTDRKKKMLESLN